MFDSRPSPSPSPSPSHSHSHFHSLSLSSLRLHLRLRSAICVILTCICLFVIWTIYTEIRMTDGIITWKKHYTDIQYININHTHTETETDTDTETETEKEDDDYEIPLNDIDIMSKKGRSSPIKHNRHTRPVPSIISHVIIYNNHYFDHSNPMHTLRFTRKPGEMYHYHSLYESLVYMNRTYPDMHIELHAMADAEEVTKLLDTLQAKPQCTQNINTNTTTKTSPSPSPSPSPCHRLWAFISDTYTVCPGSDACFPWYDKRPVFTHPYAPRSTWRLMDIWHTHPGDNVLSLPSLKQYFNMWQHQPFDNTATGLVMGTAEQMIALEQQRYVDYDRMISISRRMSRSRSNGLIPATEGINLAAIMSSDPEYSASICFYGMDSSFYQSTIWKHIQTARNTIHNINININITGPTTTTINQQIIDYHINISLPHPFQNTTFRHSSNAYCPQGDPNCAWFLHKPQGGYVDWVRWLSTCTILIGTGKPLISPTPMELIAMGGIFFDPVLKPPKNIRGQMYGSQNPFIKATLGDNWVKTIDWDQPQQIIQLIKQTLIQDLHKYITWITARHKFREQWKKQQQQQQQQQQEAHASSSSSSGSSAHRSRCRSRSRCRPLLMFSQSYSNYSISELSSSSHRIGVVHRNYTLDGIAQVLVDNFNTYFG